MELAKYDPRYTASRDCQHSISMICEKSVGGAKSHQGTSDANYDDLERRRHGHACLFRSTARAAFMLSASSSDRQHVVGLVGEGSSILYLVVCTLTVMFDRLRIVHQLLLSRISLLG